MNSMTENEDPFGLKEMSASRLEDYTENFIDYGNMSSLNAVVQEVVSRLRASENTARIYG